MTDVEIEIEGAYRHDRSAAFDRAPRTLRACASSDVAIAGRLTDRGPLDRLLGTEGKHGAELADAAYQRFGTDAFLRIGGPFALALFDRAAATLVLARDPSGAIPLFLHRADGVTRFSTDARALARDVGASFNRDALMRWADAGLDPTAAESVFESIESVAPGTAIVIDRAGRSKRRAFWTFTPLDHARGISVRAAEDEIVRALGRALARAGVDRSFAIEGEPPAHALFARAAQELEAREAESRGAPRVRGIVELRDLAAYARLLDRPIPYSLVARLASAASRDRDVAVDFGMREAFGGTESALEAFVEGLAARFAAEPRPRTLAELVAEGLPVDRALPQSSGVLRRSLKKSAAIIGRRWARHLPPRLAAALGSASDARPPIVPSLTGDLFIDRRFAEIRDPTLFALQAGLTRASAIHGHRAAVPFLDPELVELAFSLPAWCFVAKGRTMRVLAGGVSLDGIAQDVLPRAAFREADETAALFGKPPPTDRRIVDRWAGLGLYLRAEPAKR